MIVGPLAYIRQWTVDQVWPESDNDNNECRPWTRTAKEIHGNQVIGNNLQLLCPHRCPFVGRSSSSHPIRPHGHHHDGMNAFDTIRQAIVGSV